MGDNPVTPFGICPPHTATCCPTGECNQFKQAAGFQIQGKTESAPAALVYSSGYKTHGYLDVVYGESAPLNLDLASTYDRIRLSFDGADNFLNFNIVVFTDGLYSASGCNLADHANGEPFSVDFPFADFTPGGGTPGADFSNITQMVLEFGVAENSPFGEDFALTSFQAIPIGAPAADITCTGSQAALSQQLAIQ